MDSEDTSDAANMTCHCHSEDNHDKRENVTSHWQLGACATRQHDKPGSAVAYERVTAGAM